MVDITRVSTEALEEHRSHLRDVINEFVAETDSARGKEILKEFDYYIGKFWLVKPKAANLKTLLNSVTKRGE